MFEIVDTIFVKVYSGINIVIVSVTSIVIDKDFLRLALEQS